MMMHEDLEELPEIEAVTFEHNVKLGEQLLDLFDGGKTLLPHDPLFDWAQHTKNCPVLPIASSIAVIEDLAQDRFGISVSNTDGVLEQLATCCGVEFSQEPPSPVTPESLSEITSAWAAMKPSFENEMKLNTQMILIRTPKENSTEA
jgi:hypothetical protein